MRSISFRDYVVLSLLSLSRLVIAPATSLGSALPLATTTSQQSAVSSVTSSHSSTTSSATSVAASATSTGLSSLPPCGQTCIDNALADSVSLGCPFTNDEQINGTCLCSNADFGYAIRDCANQACASGTDINSILEVGISYCLAAASTQTYNASSSQSLLSTFSTVTGSGTSNPASATTNGNGVVTTVYVTGSPSSFPSSTGLSTGAKVGIGVGIPLGVIAVLTVLGFIWFKRKKQRTAKDVVADQNRPQLNLDDEKPELQANTASHIPNRTKPELEGHSTVVTSEMVTHANRHEMESSGVSASLLSPWSIDGRAELPGTAR